MQIEHDITDELYQWGWWAQLCPSRSLNYPRKVSIVPVRLDKASSGALHITDERALEIDRAIAHLFNGDEQAIRAIKLYFVCGFSYRAVANELGTSKDRAKSIIDNSVSWITGYMYKAA